VDPFLATRYAGRGLDAKVAFELPIAPLVPAIRDIYLQDNVSLHSPTRGECSLFLGEESAFSRER
jgi:hypothetical protein